MHLSLPHEPPKRLTISLGPSIHKTCTLEQEWLLNKTMPHSSSPSIGQAEEELPNTINILVGLISKLPPRSGKILTQTCDSSYFKLVHDLDLNGIEPPEGSSGKL